MVKIYDDYGDEPEDKFIPIPEHLSCSYYDLEMDSYTDDIRFYDRLLVSDADILELGCGSGRVGLKLLHGKRKLTGVDISIPMLQKARQHSSHNSHFIAMNMANLAFCHSYDAVIIPYNSLNLLVTENNIIQCLKGCRKYLQQSGLLAAQIFIPTIKFLTERKKTFQFQIFDMKPGGRLIKEILKEYHPESQTISVEERFRFRPSVPDQKSADYNSFYSVAAYTTDKWLEVIEKEGFRIINSYQDLDKTPLYSSDSSSLVVVCE